MISAIIIDDERNGRESLQKLLILYCENVSVIACASNVSDGKKIIIEFKPDLVFLDINLGKNTGFDLLNELPSNNFQLIFVTAYSEHAIKAFRLNAIDYLLKPIQPQDLQSAIAKVEKHSNSIYLRSQFESFMDSFQHVAADKQISIPTLNELEFLKLSQIIHIEGAGNYSTFHTIDDNKTTSSKGLKYYENILPSNIFYRTHQSHIVNIEFITKISLNDGVFVKLLNNILIPVSRLRKKELIQVMERRVL